MGALTILLLLSWTAVAVPAKQAEPNLSGRWTSDPEPSATAPSGGRGATPAGTAGDMGSGWGSPLTISQDASSLTVEYAFFGRGDLMPPLRFLYSLDGAETTNRVMMGRGVQLQTSRTAWNGQALVITTTYPFTDPATRKEASVTVTRTLTLQSPASLAVQTTIAGALGGPASTFKTVYRKLG